jgi:hypothetical protein
MFVLLSMYHQSRLNGIDPTPNHGLQPRVCIGIAGGQPPPPAIRAVAVGGVDQIVRHREVISFS